MCRFDASISAIPISPPVAAAAAPLPRAVESEELYLLVAKLVRVRVRRTATWGGDPEDLLHDIFVTVSQSVRDGALRNPERLGAYILATAYRQACMAFHRSIRARHMVDITDPSAARECSVGPADPVGDSEQSKRIAAMLDSLPEIDQTILRRFYLEEAKWETIAEEMNLTSTQFRLRKHRALTKVRRMAGVAA